MGYSNVCWRTYLALVITDIGVVRPSDRGRHLNINPILLPTRYQITGRISDLVRINGIEYRNEPRRNFRRPLLVKGLRVHKFILKGNLYERKEYRIIPAIV